MCCRSLFALHNETMNVWTHLVGVAFFLVVATVLFTHVLEPKILHYFVFSLFSIGCVACLACSAIFHLYYCHYNSNVTRILHRLDYVGISALVVGSFIPFCYFAFSCNPSLRWGYLGMIAALGTVGVVGPMFSLWTDQRFFSWKILFYIVFVGSGVVPTVHLQYALPNNVASPFIVGLSLMIGLYFVGVLVYAFKIPERWFPGQFDTWLHSHQLWHIFVFVAAAVHFFNCASMYIQWEAMEFHC
jgi:channel protein (hemolysin III family)